MSDTHRGWLGERKQVTGSHCSDRRGGEGSGCGGGNRLSDHLFMSAFEILSEDSDLVLHGQDQLLHF